MRIYDAVQIDICTYNNFLKNINTDVIEYEPT